MALKGSSPTSYLRAHDFAFVDGQCTACGRFRHELQNGSIAAECSGPQQGDNIVQMPAIQGATVVAVLTELLGKAQRGEIKAVAAALIYTDNDQGHTISECDEFYKLIGSIEGMKWDMLRMHQAT